MKKNINQPIRPILSVPVGIAIPFRDVGDVRAYKIAEEVGVITIGRRKFLATETIAKLIGRPVTPNDIQEAEQIVQERRERQTLRTAAKINSRKRG